ncbi:unnamed protein product, partial [Nesidiocoris tenuis]
MRCCCGAEKRIRELRAARTASGRRRFISIDKTILLPAVTTVRHMNRHGRCETLVNLHYEEIIGADTN